MALILYPIGIPLLFFGTLYKNRQPRVYGSLRNDLTFTLLMSPHSQTAHPARRIVLHTSAECKERYGGIYDAYKEEFWFYEAQRDPSF